MSDIKMKSWVIDGHEMFYRNDILDNPNPLNNDMVAFYHGEKDLYQVKRNSVYGQILFKMLNEEVSNHDKLAQKVKDLESSLDDRDCYIADADMKNEDLVKQVAELDSYSILMKRDNISLHKQVAELRAALNDVLIEYQGLGGCEVLIGQCSKALNVSE